MKDEDEHEDTDEHEDDGGGGDDDYNHVLRTRPLQDIII